MNLDQGPKMRDGIKLSVRPSHDEDVLISVIMPLAAREAEPDALVATIPRSFEVILARGGTRASSMNEAAKAARGRYLWFLHADTVLEPGTVPTLLDQIGKTGPALLYFDLRFDGGSLMRLTEWGVRLRSQLLRMPFGDQAFCIPAETFSALGGYDETPTCGEDHFLVQRARQAGLPVLPVAARVITSARKYRANGWMRTTLTHWKLTFHQARPMARDPSGRDTPGR